MTPTVLGFMCLSLVGGGSVCFHSERPSADQAPMEHLVSVICSDALDKQLGVPKCNPKQGSRP